MKKMLNEWKSYMEEKVELPQGEWTEVTPAEIRSTKGDEEVDLTQELFKLIQNAYSSIGGNFKYSSPGDVPGKEDVWGLLDIDGDDTPDALRGGKSGPHGTKLTLAGHNGAKEAVAAYLQRTADLLKQPGNYAEMSKAIAHIMMTRHGVPFVGSPEQVQRVLGPTRPIEWVGLNPNGKYPEYPGWYKREIAGRKGEMKIMLGMLK